MKKNTRRLNYTKDWRRTIQRLWRKSKEKMKEHSIKEGEVKRKLIQSRRKRIREESLLIKQERLSN